MIKEIENYDFELLRIEKGEKKKYKFVFGFENSGEWPIEMSEKYYDLFRVGNKYKGFVKINNFKEVKNKKGNVWVNLTLEKFLEKDEVVWQSSTPII